MSPYQFRGGRCRRGHDVTVPGNVDIRANGERRCRVCRRIRESGYVWRAELHLPVEGRVCPYLPLGMLLDRLRVSGVSGVSAAARLCGVQRRTMQRWRACGRLPAKSAELVCDQLGLHPVEVWGDVYLGLWCDLEDVA